MVNNGFGSVFTNKLLIDLKNVNVKLVENYAVKWNKAVLSKPKLRTYKLLKSVWGVENYLLFNLTRFERSLVAQLRLGILPLRLETGRFLDEKVEERTCKLCNSGAVEDEMHFLFSCNTYNDIRQRFYNLMNDKHKDFLLLSNINKLTLMFDKSVIQFAKYLKEIFMLRRNTIYHVN